jgi:hypothetical protein
VLAPHIATLARRGLGGPGRLRRSRLSSSTTGDFDAGMVWRSVVCSSTRRSCFAQKSIRVRARIGWRA